MTTSNEVYKYDDLTGWSTVTCPSTRAFSSGSELELKVGDKLLYRSGFKVYQSGTSTTTLEA